MKNLFENAYFGKPYKIRDGRKAIYHSRSSKVEENHLLIIENKYGYYHYDNFGRYYHLDRSLDIVSEWEEPINEEELDQLAEDYFLETYNQGIVNPELDIINEKKFAKADFKAGFRSKARTIWKNKC